MLIWKRYVPASLTVLSTSIVVDASRRNGLDRDAVISCEMVGIYKPRPESYRTAATWLAVDPSESLMVACHNCDLDAAGGGCQTAFVRRPGEWGRTPHRTRCRVRDCIVVADGFAELADWLGA